MFACFALPLSACSSPAASTAVTSTAMTTTSVVASAAPSASASAITRASSATTAARPTSSAPGVATPKATAEPTSTKTHETPKAQESTRAAKTPSVSGTKSATPSEATKLAKSACSLLKGMNGMSNGGMTHTMSDAADIADKAAALDSSYSKLAQDLHALAHFRRLSPDMQNARQAALKAVPGECEKLGEVVEIR